MTALPLVQPLDVRFSSIPFNQSSPPALQANLQGRNRDDSRNCDRDHRERPSQPSTSVSSGSPTTHLASQPPRHTPVPQSPANIPLPTSAPAHTPSFNIPPLPPLDSIQAQTTSPFVKVEPDQSPTSWSEPPRYQPRDLGTFVPYPPPYRGLENWPQTNQQQQYTYWSSQGYPAIMPPAPPQAHPAQDDKRRQRELNKARRHVCPVCDKRFNRPSSLNTHMSVHTGAKPYQCLREGCGRRFSVSSNLRRHERTHEARARPAKLPAPVAARAQMTPYHPGNQYYTPGNYYLQAPTTQPQFDYSMPSAGLRNYAVVDAGSGATQNTPRSRETMPPTQYQPPTQHSTSASTQALLQQPKSMSS